MSGHTIIPDLKWYEEGTKRKGLKEPRCPFASVEKCPRYYQSLSLLGAAGATAIDKAIDEKLQKKWEHHHLWPKTREQETSIGGPEERSHSYSRFCPEVSHEAFGLFADFLARYSDECDAEYASQRLGEIGAPNDDWRWSWQQVSPMHYADCPLYSPLLHDAYTSAEKKWWERPAGIVTLGILVTVIGGLILWGVTRHYDKGPSSAPAVEQPRPQPAQPEVKPPETTKPSSQPQQDTKKTKSTAPTVPATVSPKVEINAPNGIAIGGGTVNNPVVNNFGPTPPKPAVVSVCISDVQNVEGHDGEVKLILTLTTDSQVVEPTYGFEFSGPILSKGTSASSPDMAMNIKEGITTPVSFAFLLYQTWFPGQRINVEVHSIGVVRLKNQLGKHEETFVLMNGGCQSGL